MSAFWHGGVPGLLPGDLIQPAAVTGNSREHRADLRTRHPHPGARHVA